MKTSFMNFRITRIILFMFLLSFSLNAQVTVYITGEVRFRGYGFGVTNHSILIDVLYTSPSGSSGTGPFSTTSYCGPYDGSLEITNNGSTPTNTVTVSPSGPSSYSDVVDGVAASDIVIVQADVINTTPITDGFKKIAADVDNNDDIESNDVYFMQQVILGNYTSFNRPNWEYVSQNTTINAGFHSSPWSSVINQSTGHTYGGTSYNQITDPSFNWRLFGFYTTKVGELTISDGANSLVCGTYSFKEDDKKLTSRSSAKRSYYDVARIKKGTKFKFIVSLDETQEASAYDIPLFVDASKLQVLSLKSTQGKNPRWNHNKLNNRLTALFLDKELNVSNLIPGKLLEIELLSIEDISNLNSAVSWDERRGISFATDGKYDYSPSMSLKVEEFTSPFLTVSVPGMRGEKAIILSDRPQSATNLIIDLSGRIVSQKILKLQKGLNTIELPGNLAQGVYIMNTMVEGQKALTKYQILN